jgi:hypothetical protein
VGGADVAVYAWRKPLWIGVAVATIAAAAATGAFGDSGSGALTGRCTKAEARAVVKRLALGDPTVADPVYKVLCGSFTGPGSRTMVVSLWGPGNSGPAEWVVFRWYGNTWQFLMKQPAAASITAAGNDIRQTLPIYRPSDPRCCPTGGTKSRLWHWNGSRFVAGPWHVTRAKVDQPTRFESPSGNIECWMYDGSSSRFSPGVGCTSKIPPKSVILSVDGRLKIRRDPYACGCEEPDSPRLAYGRQITVGRFRCVSRETGVTCTVIKSGKGFLINRDGVSRVGP